MTVDPAVHRVPVPYFKMPSNEMIKYFNDFYIDTNFQDLPINTHYKLYSQPTRHPTAKGSYNIYLPDGYETDTDKSYPVLFWLHGGMQTQRQCFWVLEYYHSAMQRGDMPKTIIVAPQALPVGWYADNKDGSRPLATIMSKDLVEHIDSTYRTIAKREARWIEGFSMGGFGALHLGFKYPETYGALSMIAGALLPRLDMEPLERTGDTFFNDQDFYEKNHPSTLLRVNGEKLKGRTLLRLLSGSDDTLLTEAIANMKILLKKYDIEFNEIEVTDVAHEYNAILEGTGSYSYEFWSQAYRKVTL